MKHTPGPWHTEKRHAPNTNRIDIESDGLVIGCAICEIGMGQTEHKANAKLIAAAPDLLAALLKISNTYGITGDEALFIAESAISALREG